MKTLLELTKTKLKQMIREELTYLNEVDDDQMIKYKDGDGESSEMSAKSAKRMAKDHPAKVEYDKLAGSDDGAAKKGVNIFDEPSDTGTEKPAQINDPKALLDDMDIDYEETEDENGNKKYELEDGRELTFTDTGVVIDDDGNEEIDQWPYPPENYGYETVKDPEADWRDLPVVPHDQWAEEGQDYLSKNFPEESFVGKRGVTAEGSFRKIQEQWIKNNIL
jgi:hypothetical protein